MVPHDHETKSRLLAKLVRELLASTAFETLADLTDALKARCSSLHITCTPADISEAYRVIASNRELADAPKGVKRDPVSVPVVPEPAAIPAVAAKRIYRELLERYHGEQSAAVSPIEGGERPPDFPDLVAV